MGKRKAKYSGRACRYDECPSCGGRKEKSAKGCLSCLHPRPVVQQPSDATIRHIPLQDGTVAIVDAHAYDFLNQWKWFSSPNKRTAYVEAWTSRNGRIFKIKMHQLLIPCPKHLLIDHRDRNGLNNLTSNLRIATRSDNARNSQNRSHNTSGFRGVSARNSTSKWMASITHGGRSQYLGVFESRIDAAKAYDHAARQIQGEFAVLNFPELAAEAVSEEPRG